MRSRGRSAGLLVALLALTACSGSGGGTTAATSTTGADWTTPNGSSPSSSTSRPPALAVDDVKSCDLLTEDQRGKLGLTGESTSKSSTTWITDSCVIWDTAHKNSASVTAVSNQSMDDFYHGRFVNMQYKTIAVRGFPALFYRFDNAENSCYLAVDVADRQLVDVAYGASKKDTGQSQDEICAAALRITEAAMDTLLAKR